MTMRQKCAAVLAIVVLGGADVAAAEDTLAPARDLYAAAAYEDALVVLNRLRALTPPPEEGRAIEQYRAFCLLALGRTADAEEAIEAVVAAEPSYQPSDSEVSPRVRAAFRDVRRRMLPGIIQQQYTTAKAAFDRKDFAEAATRFTQVLAVMADPDVESAASRPPLADLRVLAAGFRDLSETAALPPPPAQPEPPALPPAPAVPPSPRIYVATDPNVVPPMTIQQSVPAYPTTTMGPTQGSLEVVIDETGAVESARMRASFNPAYDRMVLNAAREWRYRPATLDGVPVKFRKVVNISVVR
jgi:TonB family protein